MPTCPYCAEPIPEDTVICPFCRSDVRVRPAPPAAPDPGDPARVGEGALRFSHAGGRHLLGIGEDYFGIWDRQAPGGPVARFPRTDEGWRSAWLAFVRLEPHPAEVGLPGQIQRASAPTPVVVRPSATVQTRPVSAAWWLLPILLGTIGGIVAWALTRGRDPRIARSMLLTGIGLSVALLLLYLASGSS